MKVYLVDLLQMASVHESFFALSEVPQGNAVGVNTPQQIFLFVAPFHLTNVILLAVFNQTLREITDVPNLYQFVLAGCRQYVSVQRSELNRVEFAGVCFHVEDGLHCVSGVPKHGLSLVVAGGEHAIVELIEAQVLDFPVVEVEVGERSDLVALLAAADVPDGQLAVVAASDDLSLFVRTPLKRVPFGLVAREDDGRRDPDGLAALGGSAELDLVEDVDLSEGSAGGDEVGPARVMPDAVDLPVVFDLVLHDDLVSHAFVVLADGLGQLERAVLQLALEVLLVGQVHLGHDEAVLLLAGGVRAVEEVAQPILVIIILVPAFALVDPPLHAQRRPLQLLRVQSLVKVRSVSAPDELLGNILIECSLGKSHDLLHSPPIMQIQTIKVEDWISTQNPSQCKIISFVSSCPGCR